jgi:hypothetical protein
MISTVSRKQSLKESVHSRNDDVHDLFVMAVPNDIPAFIRQATASRALRCLIRQKYGFYRDLSICLCAISSPHLRRACFTAQHKYSHPMITKG